jgi:hypothetical protein
VREQLCKGKRKRLKSKDGKRDVPLSPGMVQQLLALRRDGFRGPEAPVFASSAGTPLRPENVFHLMDAGVASPDFLDRVVGESNCRDLAGSAA